jgi:hypothetical protein
VAVALAVLLLVPGSGGREVSRSEATSVLDAYQVSITNVDMAALERLLAPDFRRKLLADPPTDRSAALEQYRAGFEFRGSQPRYSLKDVRVKLAGGGATAAARYTWTAGSEPHLGDYGVVSFHLVERKGKTLIDRIETYPDVVALLPPTLSASDFPLRASLTATVTAGGARIPIAAGVSRLARKSDAVIVPLSQTGRRILHGGQDFRVRMRLELRGGRTLSTVSKPYHFLAGSRPARP